MNNLLYIVCNFLYKKNEVGSLLSDASFVQFCKEVKYRAFALPYLLILIVFFLTSQTSSEDVSSENEWLEFLSPGAKEARYVPNAKIGNFVISAFNEEKV